MKRKRIIIMGAAGRDFHEFNICFRDREEYEVVAFTAAQIPNIAGRVYPPELAGKLYPNGIRIYPEEELPKLIKRFDVDEVVFAYSDVSYEYVMERASLALYCGADFRLVGTKNSMLESKKPVISVCATRTGAGKSTVSRKIAKLLREMGYNVGIVRHPMPYGDLRKQVCQKFTSYEDLIEQECTLEEQEEYNQHIENGFVVFAGVDYKKILKEVEKEFDIILFDGGNNDLPFFKPDLHVVVADPLRAGDELRYYPSATNVRMANVVIINKVNVARADDIKTVERNVRMINPKARIIKAASNIHVDKPRIIRESSVVCVEDGPSVTHGNMSHGVAFMAAKKFKAKSIIDPRPYAVGSIKDVYKKYPHIGNVLPALGYGKKQLKELEATLKRISCDAIILGTPADLTKVLRMDKPMVRVRFELKETGKLTVREVLSSFLRTLRII